MLSSVLYTLFFGTAIARGITKTSILSRQDGPVDAGIPADCTYWDTALSKTYTCAYFESQWGLTHAQFVEYNPSVKSDCTGIQVGHSYCVEVNNGQPRPTTTSKAAPTPTGNGIVTPTPIRDGMTTSCDAFYFVKAGDQCGLIATANGIALTDFYKWNPAVGTTCNALWADTYVCVSIIGVGPSTTTSGTKPTTTGNGIATPAPIRDGMATNCDAFYFVKAGDQCGNIATANGITLTQFNAWNPSAGATCTGLWADTYVCVSIIGVGPVTTTTTSAKPTTTGNGIATPSPIRDGMVKNCDDFYFVKSGDQCGNIATAKGISLTQFYAWNPAVGTTCNALWADTYVCVSIVGVAPSTTTKAAASTTAAGNGVATPTPIQAGMTTKCKTFRFVVTGDTCATIASKAGITVANFISWNPAVGSTCTGLWLNTYACIAIL